MGFYLRNANLIGSVWAGTGGVFDVADAFYYASPFAKIGTTVYDATSLGALTYITELEAAFHSAYPSVISGYLKYIIKDSASTTKTIVAAFRKSAAGVLSQSIFSAYNNTPSVGAVSSILFYSNDDHDTLFMDGDGGGVISRINNNAITGSSQYDKFFGTTVTVTSSAVNTAMNFSPASFIASSSNLATIVSFPGTSSAIWFDLTAGKYKVNNFTAQNSPSDITTYISSGAPTNSVITISDGINMFLIYRMNQTSAVECRVDLSTGLITTSLRSFSQATFYNTTEEDAIGAQLFAVDGAPTWQNGTTYNYTRLDSASTGYGWREVTALSAVSSTTIGSLSTQTGMDIMSSIDSTDSYVWFADWGHDDGGLFNGGNDSQLNTAKSNIQKIPSTYNN